MQPTRALIGIIALLVTTATSFAQERMTPELLWRLGRLGGAAVSSDGSRAVYAVRHYDLAENAGTSSVHVVDVESGATRTLVRDWAGAGDLQFAPTPFGERVLFTGSRAKGEKPQVWALNPLDGALLQVTDLADGAGNLKVSPDGKRIAFTADVKLDETVNEIFEDLPKADARIIDSLMYRHWNAWHDYAYSHVFVAPNGAPLALLCFHNGSLARERIRDRYGLDWDGRYRNLPSLWAVLDLAEFRDDPEMLAREVFGGAGDSLNR